ncbi:hypothetical protein PoB_007494300 [Plakobranchus ocellatus]|uniref:MYND-type domain-containing protein n=1 Tax=Plakobranchus ocellatus TaxID=259542 RepID=A0AAV4DW16_9GAST|nr:hypothetical protein PoB_007494300 [Plakobranchus ocellatus]
MMKASVKKGVKKEIVMCKEQLHYAYGHSKEEAIAKAEQMALAQMLQNIQGQEFGHNSHSDSDDGPDLDFELPEDAWIPSTTASKSRKSMISDIYAPPFSLPVEVENHKKINDILHFSLRQQKEEEISDNSAIVSHLVSRCLAAAGIQNRVAYGYRRARQTSSSTPKDAKSNQDGHEVCLLAKTPHVWLTIQGHVIDNTYCKDLPIECRRYLSEHASKCYEEAKLEYTNSVENFGANAGLWSVESVEKVRTVMKKRIEFCMRHPDMALALGHNNEHFYNYFFAMIRYMYEEFGVSVSGIDSNIRLICWWCDSYPQRGKDLYSDTLALRLNNAGSASEESEQISTVNSLSTNSWRFLQCGRCMVANYCSQNCQRHDWADNHHATCLPRGSVSLPPISNISYGMR